MNEQTTSSMAPQEFIRLCQDIVGDHRYGRGSWQTQAANSLRVSSTTIRNYATGRIAISEQVAEHVRLWHREALRERSESAAGDA